MVTETPLETIEFQELIVVVAFCIINLSESDNLPLVNVGSAFAKLFIYCIAQSISSETSLIMVAVAEIDLGISIVFVAKMVFLNFAKLFDKFIIFRRATNIEVKNAVSLIIFTFCNLVVKFWNKALNSSAAVANSLNPSILISNAIVFV